MYKCNYCGREFKNMMPHRCKGGFRKHKLSFSQTPEKISERTEIDNRTGRLKEITECKYFNNIKVGSEECMRCSFCAGRDKDIISCTNNIPLILNTKSGGYKKAKLHDFKRLLQLRDYYNKQWVPNWTDSSTKYCIKSVGSKIISGVTINESRVLSFKDEITRDLFYNQFRKLIESVQDLI